MSASPAPPASSASSAVSASSASDLLSQTIDAYIGWLTAWHRLAFPEKSDRAPELPDKAQLAFRAWRKAALQSLPEDEAGLDKIAALHEQLHTLARLVLIKSPPGQMGARRDYEAVIAKYEELVFGLRRFERAFAVAASGLDNLTGLRSRSGLADDFAREQGRFLRGGRPFCIALMDIDHFKAINDSFGHDAGDKVLASVADLVSRDMRSFDDAYRWGGEEFLLCLKEADSATGAAILERLRTNLAVKPIGLGAGKTVPVTASFGFTVSNANRTPEDLIRAADQALYSAKNSGRNKVVMTADPPV
ncbi:MAG: diguanylate cyclase [Pseudomonadota bacterium]|nr:diguanylate cyclase [Pseudomonadota bacterium]